MRLRITLQRVPGHPRQRGQQAGLARRRVTHVVKKCAELRVRQIRRGVDYLLDDDVALQRGRQGGANLAQLFV